MGIDPSKHINKKIDKLYNTCMHINIYWYAKNIYIYRRVNENNTHISHKTTSKDCIRHTSFSLPLCSATMCRLRWEFTKIDLAFTPERECTKSHKVNQNPDDGTYHDNPTTAKGSLINLHIALPLPWL